MDSRFRGNDGVCEIGCCENDLTADLDLHSSLKGGMAEGLGGIIIKNPSALWAPPLSMGGVFVFLKVALANRHPLESVDL
jgi:hypothetical protein